MKQGKIYTKLILLALLLAVLCYLGYAVFSALHEPLATVLAIEYEAGAGCHTQGYVVRDETVLTSQYAITVLNRNEGERVGIGQTVATGYLTADAQERQSEIAALSTQLEQLQYAYSYSLDTADAAGLDNEIRGDLTAMAQYVARRDLNAVSELSAELKGLILRRSTGETDLASIRSQMETLQSQLSQLRSVSTSDTMRIAAPSSGYFSGTVDGYESVLTPSTLTSMTVADFQSIQAGTPPENACGRLISSPTWYYVTAVDSDYVKEVEAGDWVTISFSHDFYNTLRMRITRIGDEESGQRLLVLESSDYIQNVTLLRGQSADVVFNAYAGLRVPKNALHLDEDNQPGVYILESAAAKWKSVTILYDNGESYVVELDKSDTGNLWPGDEIIVGAKNLYDGKVVSTQ